MLEQSFTNKKQHEPKPFSLFQLSKVERSLRQLSPSLLQLFQLREKGRFALRVGLEQRVLMVDQVVFELKLLLLKVGQARDQGVYRLTG